MTKIVYIGGIMLLLIVAGVQLWLQAPGNTAQPQGEATNDGTVPTTTTQRDTNLIHVVAEALEVPWGLDFLPNGDLLVSERPGVLTILKEDREAVIIPVPNTSARGEGGLLGVALHPEFATNSYIYLYRTQASGSGLVNRVERYTFTNEELSERVIILEGIPGAPYHDGGRIAFGPDGYLYITSGDAGDERSSQNTDSLAGKILRVRDDGTIPEDNPFGNAVYSYGHRNPQGLAWDSEGRLWSTEHGRSGLRSGHDELNLIHAGANYGWPASEGDTVNEGTIGPVVHSGIDTTWAPASAVYYEGSIFLLDFVVKRSTRRYSTATRYVS